jgi:hypothetical protein
MNVTRRKFIERVGITALAAASATSVGKVFAQSGKADGMYFRPAESAADPLNYLSRQHFEPFINTAFEVSGEGGAARLTLIEVNAIERKTNESRGYSGESFSLIFRGSAANKLEQGTYQVRHGALGEHSLLVVPVGRKGTRYEVIINLIVR